MNANPSLCASDRSLLLIVDPQEKLMPMIAEAARTIANIELLIRAAQASGIPVVPTVQNSQRLGGLVPSLASCIGTATCLDKMSFSAARDESIWKTIQGLGRDQVVVCGVETHICVLQTAADLHAAGFQVHVVADAVSSRTVERHKLGMERIRDLGILPAATESVVFEWLERAGTERFRNLLPLLKQ